MRATRVSEDVVGVSELRARAAELLERIAETGAPLIVTQHGRAAGVLLSPEAFDDVAERARFLDAVGEGLADVEAGRTVSHSRLAEQMERRFPPAVRSRAGKRGRQR